MKLHVVRLIIQAGLISLFFFPIMHQKDELTVMFNGFEAVMQGDYLIIGNIVIALVMLGSIYHLIVLGFELVSQVQSKKLETSTNMVINITVILGFVLVTFLGTFLELFGYLILVLLIVSTYLRYLSQNIKE